MDQSDELQRLRNALEEERDFRDRVVKTVTHDLQNLLMGVQGFAQLALLCEEPHEKDRNLEDVVSSCRVMREMMENVNTYARLGSVQAHPRSIDLAALAREVTGPLRAAFPNLSFETPAVSAAALADPRLVRNVLQQLLTNAARYSQMGSVTVAVEPTDGEVRVTVSDQGVGIPAHLQGELFQAFYRARRPDTSEIPGAGLGLAIVRGLVEKQGGRAWIESAHAQGTRAYFTLPAVS